LAQLVRRQLLRIERRDEKPRKVHYRSTERFLKLFGLECLDDLPRSQDLEKR
jgi:segregation and condensation protein B